MLITNSIICTKCKNEIDWYYPVFQKFPGTILAANKYPTDKEKAFGCTPLEYNIYELKCYCKHCGHHNVFKYESDIKL